jgi:hypothetical protein
MGCLSWAAASEIKKGPQGLPPKLPLKTGAPTEAACAPSYYACPLKVSSKTRPTYHMLDLSIESKS